MCLPTKINPTGPTDPTGSTLPGGDTYNDRKRTSDTPDVGSVPINPKPNAPDPVVGIDVGNPNPAPAAPAAPPAPGATPSYEDPNPQETAAQRLARLRKLRGGIAQTIKTSPLGVADGGSLAPVPGLYTAGVKSKLGQ